MSYEQKCLELSGMFLSDEPREIYTNKNVSFLAQSIQDTIENFIAEKHQDLESMIDSMRDDAADAKREERLIDGREP